MNPASRLLNFINKIKSGNSNVKIIDVYYQAFKVDNPFAVYHHLHLLSKEVEKFKGILDSSGQSDTFKEIILNLEKIVTPLVLTNPIHTIQGSIAQVESQLPVFSVAFENQQFAENNVQEDLTGLQKDLDEFLKKLKNIKTDDQTKILFAKVAYKLKESISMYEISGIDGIHEHMKIFKCITKDYEESKNINSKFDTILNRAAATTGLLGFTAGTNFPDLIALIG